ncbi:nuclear transport factor 2 family protein [Williamsia muralis]|uniref:Polyketide cyclase n=1 Tax=Williamsia marianensis TaxID=85044 RepID=A0A2G3PN75_WILMA|nr:nuclear transport factor 2 family protein [Williamsia marianensis]PHV67287.1 polyketide cyclase [Williamsia marianensis]PZU03858.1 MAG: nuclear transport factor 2 family protein [Gordonia sp. (in: high G+C Gram-positive bacteria)]
MTEMTAMVDDYLSAWNETDPGARRTIVEKVWDADGVYTDPLASVTGTEAIDQVLAGAQQQFAGMRFVRGDVFETHHNIARFTWELVPENGAEAVVIGFDVVAVNNEKISSVYGFIDKMPGQTAM